MYNVVRTAVACVTVLALVLVGFVPRVVAADAPSARLEGLLIGGDGRPADGHKVHLIGTEGEGLASSETDNDGLYSFKEVAAGEYSLGIENPDGLMAPVAGPPVRVAAGELARRDLQLMEADAETLQRIASANPSIGQAYAGWTTAGRVWFWIAVVAGLGIGVAALDSESAASEQMPQTAQQP